MQLMTAALAVTYLVTAPIIAYAIFSRLAWRGRASWVLIGVGFMLLALIPQVITQGIPILIVLLTHIREVMIGGVSSITDLVLGLIKSSFYLMAIYMGLMAGIFQEAFRYLAIRDREPGSAPYIGYGFALVDLAFTIMSLVLPLLIPTSVNPGIEYANVISTIGLVGIAVQPIVSILFHLGSSMVLKTYQALNKGFRGLILMVLAHAYMNSFTWYMDNAVALAIINSSLIMPPLSTVYFTSVVSLSAFIFIIGFRAFNYVIHRAHFN